MVALLQAVGRALYKNVLHICMYEFCACALNGQAALAFPLNACPSDPVLAGPTAFLPSLPFGYSRYEKEEAAASAR